jgi:hypothetical protein
VTHIYIKPSSSECSPASRVASAAGRLRPNALTGEVRLQMYGYATTRDLGEVGLQALLSSTAGGCGTFWFE